MSLFKNLFGSEAKAIEVYTAPPVVVNSRSEFTRNVNRIVNLYRAILQEDLRQEVVDELEQRRQKCLEFGHPVPYTLEEAEELQKKVTR